MVDSVIVPDFSRDRMEGQLTEVERKTLYDTVILSHPSVVFEVGTWCGGGSTYFIASALRNMHVEGRNAAKVYTAEVNPIFFNHAQNLYRTDMDMGELAYLAPYVSLHFGDALEHFKSKDFPVRGYAFLDGAEEPEPTLEQFEFFDKNFIRGSVIAFHDWDTCKTDLVRPILKDHPMWTLWQHVDGLCIFRKRKV